MWDNITYFVCVCVISYLLKQILSMEPNKVKYQFKFFIYYFLTSVVAFFIWPFFLLRPKSVKNIAIDNSKYDKLRIRPLLRLRILNVPACFASKIVKHITKIIGIKWELRNGEILAEDRGAIIIANHQSSLDILGAFNIWELADKMTVVGKKEILYVQPLGLAAYLGGIVFIDRNNGKRAFKQLDTASEVMTKHKTKILFYPEGTRNKDYTKLLPFKKGAFVMAVRAQVPIIPILFSPYYFINPKKYIFNNGEVIIQCLEPIPTKGLTLDDVDDLVKKTYDVMQAEYMKLSKEVFHCLPDDYPHSTVG